MKASDLLDSIPVRKYCGVLVPYVCFKEIIRLLKNYRFTDAELSLISQEIAELRRVNGI